MKLARISDKEKARTVWEEAERLWDISPARRFVKLASLYPELLTYEEQRLLWVIKKYPAHLQVKRMTSAWFISEDGTIEENAVEECWDEIRAFAQEEIDRATLEKVMDEKLNFI